MITQAELKELLTYDPRSGNFIWLVNRNGYCGIKIGDIAGSDNGKGYRLIGINRRKYMASNLAYLYMEGKLPSGDIDHIDGNPRNNKWSNLRHVSHQSNMKNMKLHVTNTSGFCGVSKIKATGRYHAYIHINGKRKHLGCFPDKEGAILARKAANIKYNYHDNHGRTP